MDERAARAQGFEEEADGEDMTDVELMQDSALLRQQIKAWLAKHKVREAQAEILLEQAIRILDRFEYQTWVETDDGK